jgi:hypothetical protein
MINTHFPMLYIKATNEEEEIMRWADFIDIPFGYEKILNGKVRKSDLVYNAIIGKFEHPTNNDYKCIGSDVEHYYCVVRKSPIN